MLENCETQLNLQACRKLKFFSLLKIHLKSCVFFKDVFLAFISFILIGQSVDSKGTRREGGGIGKGQRAGTQTPMRNDAICRTQDDQCATMLYDNLRMTNAQRRYMSNSTVAQQRYMSISG